MVEMRRKAVKKTSIHTNSMNHAMRRQNGENSWSMLQKNLLTMQVHNDDLYRNVPPYITHQIMRGYTLCKNKPEFRNSTFHNEPITNAVV